MRLEDEKLVDEICDLFESELSQGMDPEPDFFLPLVEPNLRFRLYEMLIRTELAWRIENRLPIDKAFYQRLRNQFDALVNEVFTSLSDQ